MLNDLSVVYSATLNECAKIPKTGLRLSDQFVVAYTNYINSTTSVPGGYVAVEFDVGSAVLTSAPTGNSDSVITCVSAYGFAIAHCLTPLMKELTAYKSRVDQIFSGRSKADAEAMLKEVRKMPASPTAMAQLEGLLQTLPADEQGLVKKFVTDYSWWHGQKGIERDDFMYSPMLSCSKLVAASNGAIPTITKHFSAAASLYSAFKFSTVQKDTVMSNQAYQIITYGAPGTGKSKQTKDEVAGHLWYRTTFHPDSDYASFVGAYKPRMREDGVALTEVSQKDAAGQLVGTEIHDQRKGIAYDFVDQVFTKAYVEAWKLQKKAAADATPEPVFLVIEEINRGNCAQIFGDIFQLLDRNGMGFSEYPVEPDSDLGRFIAAKISEDEAVMDAARKNAINGLYPEAKFDVVEKVLKGEQLLLPDNLYIRATMNTSDQSLFPMDSAFKRRWDWKYVPICEGLDKDTKQPLGWKIKLSDGEVDWWKFLLAINKVVKGVTNSADKQMGYFFVRAKDSVIDAEMFVNKVAFYLWNDVFKDCELDGEAFKITREDGEVDVLAFQDFFKEDGTVNEEVLKNFLTTLVPQPESVPGEAGAAPGAGGES